MQFQNRSRIILYAAIFVLSFGLGVYLYFEWFLILAVVVLSGAIVFSFPKDSFLARLLVGTPQIGLISGAVFALLFLGDFRTSAGPSLDDAAAQGNAEAQYALGLIEIFREGNDEIRWLLASAKQENGDAQLMLGLPLGKELLHPDYAYMFLTLADKNDVRRAREPLARLVETMSPKQIDVGQEFVSSWRNGTFETTIKSNER